MRKTDVTKLANRIVAKRKVAQAGKIWQQLPAPERAAAIHAARGKSLKQDRMKALVILAKRQAVKADLVWAKMTKEERQKLMYLIPAAK